MEHKNYQYYLYLFDFIGINPSLRIFNYENYKTAPSFIISIIILLICISFIIFSFIEFLNQTPDLIYYKSIDINTEKKISLNNSFLMFKVDNGYSKENLLDAVFFSNENIYVLDYEYCEIGKNIDYKYKDMIETFEKNEKQNISEYFCIKFNENTTLYNDIYNNNIRYLELDLLIETTEDYINSPSVIYILTENDIINNNDKNNPIVPFYHFNQKSIHNNIAYIYYNYQYIKFDSDEGIFFRNYKSYNAIGFSNMEYDSGIYDGDSILISISFNINKLDYDLYIRKYRRIQSFLADIMSIINLTVVIGKFIGNILLNKLMARDILINIIDNNYNNRNKNETGNDCKIKKKLNYSDIKEKNKFNLEHTNIKSNISDIEKINKSNINNLKISKHKTDTKIRALKTIKYFNFTKSLFCYKDIKSKLINFCFELINEQMCIDNILKRIFILEKHCKSLSNFNLFASKYKHMKCFVSKVDEENKKFKCERKIEKK